MGEDYADFLSTTWIDPERLSLTSDLHRYEVTSLSDTSRQFIYTPSITTTPSISTIRGADAYTYGEWRTVAPDPRPYKDIDKLESGKVMEVTEHIMPQENRKCFTVKCMGELDLSADHILKNLSKMKGKLMLDSTPYRIKKVECYMTPAVKQNLIKAGRRLAMYGKERPFIARFDEYGRRLPDEIKLDTVEGMTLKIVNPEDYGPYFMELRGFTYVI